MVNSNKIFIYSTGTIASHLACIHESEILVTQAVFDAALNYLNGDGITNGQFITIETIGVDCSGFTQNTYSPHTQLNIYAASLPSINYFSRVTSTKVDCNNPTYITT